MQSPRAITSLKTSNEGQHYLAQASYTWCNLPKGSVSQSAEWQPPNWLMPEKHYHLVALEKGQYATSGTAVEKSPPTSAFLRVALSPLTGEVC